MTREEAYAVGYYYGRAIGDDEPLREELGELWWEMGGAAKEGYDRGVSDYVDEVHGDEDES